MDLSPKSKTIAAAAYVDFSIVIVDSSPSNLLDRAVRSALSQMLPGLSCEVIVLTNKSSGWPNLPLSRHHMDAITLIEHQEKGGQEEAYLRALENTNGRYVQFISSNDYFGDYCCLTEIVFLFDHSSSHGVGVDYWRVEIDTDTKKDRVSFIDHPRLACIAFRRESAHRLFSNAIHNKGNDENNLALRASRDFAISHLPIAFLRCSPEIPSE